MASEMVANERKRPWYLVLSLLAALAFGANAARRGWLVMLAYHVPIESSLMGKDIADEGDRAALVARVDAYVRVLDEAKPRAWPVGVASLLLGGATLFFAMRAMSGSRSARTALLQLVIAQAALSATSHWLLRDVDEAEVRLIEAQAAAKHENVPIEMLRGAYSVVLASQLLGSALIVVALTRRRSRDFFDASASAVRER